MLYTGKGDSGSSVLIKNGPAVPKSSALIEAMGTLDEINSFLGLCKVKAQKAVTFEFTIPDESQETKSAARIPLAFLVHEMQEALFTIQAEVVTPEKYTVPQAYVRKLELLIAQIEKEIPAVTSFCIAGGTEVSALLDIARTLARRAERAVITAIDSKETAISSSSRAYLNRLSSALYAMARYANHQAGVTEVHPTYLRQPKNS